jgi:glyceraldehyde-3-phosphate dehydrogenase/erythrose-4-phosphate dehydrogenase
MELHMIRMALIGAGRIGQIHGENMSYSPNVELVAITDTVDAAAEQLSKTLSVPVQSTDNPTTQHNVQHLPFPVAFSCETNKNGDYAAGSSLLIQ